MQDSVPHSAAGPAHPKLSWKASNRREVEANALPAGSETAAGANPATAADSGHVRSCGCTRSPRRRSPSFLLTRARAPTPSACDGAGLTLSNEIAAANPTDTVEIDAGVNPPIAGIAIAIDKNLGSGPR
jgi:hypothetical protein